MALQTNNEQGEYGEIELYRPEIIRGVRFNDQICIVHYIFQYGRMLDIERMLRFP
jgi:hypothetical protein